MQSILTWNLRLNIEDRNLEVVNDNGIRFSKGVQSSLNYINMQQYCYDVEYGFPLKFFAD